MSDDGTIGCVKDQPMMRYVTTRRARWILLACYKICQFHNILRAQVLGCGANNKGMFHPVLNQPPICAANRHALRIALCTVKYDSFYRDSAFRPVFESGI